MIENICTNRISLRYHGNEETQLESSKVLFETLNKKYKVIFNEHSNLGTVIECVFESNWTCPIELLDSLSTNYNIDIIGVAYEFIDGYVEAFELLAKIPEEEKGSFIIIDEGKAQIIDAFIEEDDILEDDPISDITDSDMEKVGDF